MVRPWTFDQIRGRTMVFNLPTLQLIHILNNFNSLKEKNKTKRITSKLGRSSYKSFI